MNKLSMCRICLNENAQHILGNTQLQETYEILTTIPFQTTDMRPLLLCCICHSQLKACRRLMLKCLKAEELLTQMVYQLHTNEAQIPILIDQSALNQLSVSPIEHTIIHNVDQNIDIIIKEEIATFSEEDVKLEELEDLQETADNTDSVPEHEQRLLDQEDDTPFNNIKYDMETLREQKMMSVRSNECNGLEIGAVVSKKPRHKSIFNKSTKDLKYVNADTDNNDAINDDEINDSKSDLEKHIIMYKGNLLENSNLTSFVEDSKLKICSLTKKQIICDICKKCFSGKSYLISHLRMHTMERPNACKVHQKSHIKSPAPAGGKLHICIDCKKCSNRKSNLTAHARIHTGEIPHPCKVCNKGQIKSNAPAGEKPHICKVCKKCFNRKSNLTAHARIHTGERPHACKVCNKSFHKNSDFKKHARIHTGEKPYACNVCKKSFSRKDVLVAHMRIHTGERPYPCNVCTKTFKQKRALTSHARVHARRKPYGCKVCKKSYKNKDVLTALRCKHTGEKSTVKFTES